VSCSTRLNTHKKSDAAIGPKLKWMSEWLQLGEVRKNVKYCNNACDWPKIVIGLKSKVEFQAFSMLSIRI
jgi:hypothetical protein